MLLCFVLLGSESFVLVRKEAENDIFNKILKDSQFFLVLRKLRKGALDGIL